MVEVGYRAGSHGEDAVSIGGGADVDLDPGPEPVDVRQQQRVRGELAGRAGQRAGADGLPGAPRRFSPPRTGGSRVTADPP